MASISSYLFFLRTLRSVFRTALSTSLNTRSVQCTTNNVVPNTRKVFHTTAAHKNNAVFLEVMSFSTDVCIHLFTVGQANTSNLSHCRVWLLRSGGVHTHAHPSSLRTRVKRSRLRCLDFGDAPLADELLNCWHISVSIDSKSFTQNGLSQKFWGCKCRYNLRKSNAAFEKSSHLFLDFVAASANRSWGK